MGWDVEGRGRDGRRRWSGTDGVRGAVGGGRRRTDIGEGWFMVGNGVSPYRLMAKVSACAGVNSCLNSVQKSSQSKNLFSPTFSGCCSQRKIRAVHFCARPDFM